MYAKSNNRFSGPEYQAFKIVSVAKYEKPAPTPWHKTATGIIVICFSVLGLVFLIAVSLSLTWYYRYYRPKRRYVLPPTLLVTVEILFSYFVRLTRLKLLFQFKRKRRSVTKHYLMILFICNWCTFCFLCLVCCTLFNDIDCMHVI